MLMFFICPLYDYSMVFLHVNLFLLNNRPTIVCAGFNVTAISSTAGLLTKRKHQPRCCNLSSLTAHCIMFSSDAKYLMNWMNSNSVTKDRFIFIRD